jgi:signal transduction histidine kinase
MEQMSQMSWLELGTEFTAQDFDNMILPLREGKQRKIVFFTRFRRSDESSYPVEVHLQTSSYETEPAFVAIVLDITQREHAEDSIRRTNRDLALLNRIIASSAASLDPESILDTACRELAQAFEVYGALAVMFSGNQTTARIVAHYNRHQASNLIGRKLAITRHSLISQISNNKAPFSIDVLKNKEVLGPYQRHLNTLGIRSLLFIPLSVEGELTGCLILGHNETRDFSTRERTLASNVANQVAGALGRIRLAHNQKQLESQYFRAQKMEAIGLLTGGIAHDFNNLLTAINGYAELLSVEMDSNDRLKAMVDSIVQSGERAATLIRQLMVFSRKERVEPKILDLNLIVSDMEKMLRRLIGEHIRLDTVLSENLWSIKADPAQIEQVIVNLVVNARDAMPGGGSLLIETSNVDIDEHFVRSHFDAQAGSYVVLSVSDTGYGMSQEVQSHIFEPFFSTKENGKGTGLGLATTYGIVKEAGGNIWVYSEEGVGTTFKIYLPQDWQSVAASFARGDTKSGNAERHRNRTPGRR